MVGGAGGGVGGGDGITRGAARTGADRRTARALSIVSRAERTMSSPSDTKSFTTPTAFPSKLRMRFETDMPRRRAWSFSSVSSDSGTRVWITRSFVLRSAPASAGAGSGSGSGGGLLFPR